MAKIAPYSKEFKREAVQLLRSSGRPVPQLAAELGVSLTAAMRISPGAAIEIPH